MAKVISAKRTAPKKIRVDWDDGGYTIYQDIEMVADSMELAYWAGTAVAAEARPNQKIIPYNIVNFKSYMTGFKEVLYSKNLILGEDNVIREDGPIVDTEF